MQQLFLKLFTCFVREQEFEDRNIELSQEDWQQLHYLANLHQIQPIIFEMMTKLSSFQTNPPVMAPIWKKNAMMAVVTQTRNTMNFIYLYEQMKAIGICPLVVKGIVCRNLYCKPDYRMSGDEDLFVKKEDFWTLDKFLLNHGFQKEESDEDLQAKMDTLHEVGYRNFQNGMYLEVHLTLFAEESGACAHYNRLFENVHTNAIEEMIEGTKIYTLSPTDHFLYLLCHSAKHFLHSGFGVRQVFDIILFAERYGTSIHWHELIEKTKANHLYVFMIHLFDIGVKYMGFDIQKSAYPEELSKDLDSGEMLEDMMAGGIFGASSPERLHSANLTVAAANQEERNNGILSSLFPKRSYMEKKYEYVKKHPWLLPVGWIHRILEYMTKEKNVDNKKVLKVGNQRVAMLKKYGMID